jgi:hypothetical protein
MHSSPSRLQFSHSPQLAPLPIAHPPRCGPPVYSWRSDFAPCTLPQLFRLPTGLHTRHNSTGQRKLSALTAALPGRQSSHPSPHLSPLSSALLPGRSSFPSPLPLPWPQRFPSPQLSHLAKAPPLAAALPSNHSSSLRHSHSDLPHDW